MKRKNTWVLWFISLISLVMIFPYMLEYIDRNFGFEMIPVSQPLFILLTFIQTGAYLAIACFAGSWFISKTGLAISLGITQRKTLLSVLLGISVGLSILIIDYFFHIQKVTPTFFSVDSFTIWKGFLASFYGGVTEEILLRYFVLSMIVYLILKLIKGAHKSNSRSAFIIAIVLSALLFGVGHLPIVAIDTCLSVVVVLRVIMINSLGGIVFGLIYWKWGLPSAMMSHFSADFILLVIFPLMNS